VTVKLAVQLEDGSYGTGAQTGYAEHREASIGGIAVRAQLEPALEILGERQALLDVARSASAYLDDVLPQGSETELVVEGGHAVDSGYGSIQCLGHPHHGCLGEKALPSLQFLKNGYELLAGQVGPIGE
jgi:hypothetical protein